MRPEEERRKATNDDGVAARARRSFGDEDGLHEATADPAFFLNDPESETDTRGGDTLRGREET